MSALVTSLLANNLRSLLRLMASCVESLRERSVPPQIRLILRLDAVDAMVAAEAVQLEWVLLNLAANSRDAMSEGGVFEVRTASVTLHRDTSSHDVRYIRVTVTDTGHGLSEAISARACEPFVSTREGHAGLGLTSVALIVGRFHGWLHIESDSTGTQVHIHLPTLVQTRR